MDMSSEMSTNCREAAIAKNRQERAKVQKVGNKARTHIRDLWYVTFSIFQVSENNWKIRVFSFR